MFLLYSAISCVLILRAYCQDVAYPYNHLQENRVAGKDKSNRIPLYAPNRCPANQLLYPGDQQDDWICDCKPGFVYSPAHHNCFAIFRQGPCKKGFHLTLKSGEVIPECVENPCEEGYARYSDGKCYELGKPGDPCPEEIIGGGVFNINETTLMVECVKELNPTIFNYVDKHPGTTLTKRMNTSTTLSPQISTKRTETTTKIKSNKKKSWVVVKEDRR